MIQVKRRETVENTNVMDLFRLDGKVSLITGGARNLGFYVTSGMITAIHKNVFSINISRSI